MIFITKTTGLAALALCGVMTGLDDGQDGSELTPVIEISAGQAGVASATRNTRDIDLALCLDTSGSMEGLIDSARQRLWALVNDLALAEPTPHIRVALLAYGTPAYGEETGYVKTYVPLTEDLDMVSLRLFELTTNGGDEYVARVTQTAATTLEWSKDPQALKMIVVAGNESAEQDQTVSLEIACSMAIEQGIVVNSLYCAQGGATQQVSNRAQGLAQSAGNVVPAVTPPSAPTRLALQPLDSVALGWKKVSTLADGAFAMIDQSSGVAVLETPFDVRLIELSSALNDTYIPYGSNASWNASNQRVQDSNASGLNNEAAASRAQTKGGKLYFCGWDLVDALDGKQLVFAEIKKDDLPEALRELSPEELKAHVDAKREARGKLQAEIGAAGVEREAWLLKKRAELGTDESMAFDTPLRKAFHELANARGFRFPQPKPIAVETAPVEEVIEPESQQRPEGESVTQTW